MRRVLGFGMVAVLLLVVVGAAPVMAANRASISIDAATSFDDPVNAFAASGLPGCASGVVQNSDVNFAFTRTHGIYAGYKVFACANDTNGFVLRLNARFGESGSAGTWAVIDAWGSLSGMTGAGGLIGEPIDNGIFDHYTGTATFR